MFVIIEKGHNQTNFVLPSPEFELRFPGTTSQWANHWATPTPLCNIVYPRKFIVESKYKKPLFPEHKKFSLCSCSWQQNLHLQWWMLKAPSLKSLDLHFSVLQCHCGTYDDNIDPKFKKAKLCNIGGVQYVWKLSLTVIDPRFVWNFKFIRHIPLLTFFLTL